MMKAKKILINIFVLLFAFCAFAFWYNHDIKVAKQTTASELTNFKVYLITADKDSYWKIIDQGASEMAKSLGVNYIWNAPEERSVAKQIDIIKKAVNDGANALLVAADDPKKISSTIEDAKARSVKIIYVDSAAYEEAIVTLSSDNYQAGIAAGHAMLSELEKQGITSGLIGIVSVAAKQNTQLREEGFRKVIQEDNKFTLLETVNTNGDVEVSHEAANLLIQKHKDLVGIFGTNQTTSEGVGYAIKEANNRIVGIGFDKTDTMLQLLNDGNLKALIVQNPFTMGYLGMAEAVAAILGKDTGPSYLDTGISVLEK